MNREWHLSLGGQGDPIRTQDAVELGRSAAELTEVSTAMAITSH